MRKALAATLTGALVLALQVGAVGSTPIDEPEGCQAFNPGQPTCSYTVTHTTESPVTGFAAVGKWEAKIKRGKKTIKVSGPAAGEPTAVTFEFEVGDKVSVTTLSPGSGVIAGHGD